MSSQSCYVASIRMLVSKKTSLVSVSLAKYYEIIVKSPFLSHFYPLDFYLRQELELMQQHEELSRRLMEERIKVAIQRQATKGTGRAPGWKGLEMRPVEMKIYMLSIIYI